MYLNTPLVILLNACVNVWNNKINIYYLQNILLTYMLLFAWLVVVTARRNWFRTSSASASCWDTTDYFTGSREVSSRRRATSTSHTFRSTHSTVRSSSVHTRITASVWTSPTQSPPYVSCSFRLFHSKSLNCAMYSCYVLMQLLWTSQLRKD